MAFASDPDLFVKQGNAFHSKGLESEAISSYEKALQFYQERGDSTKSQEIQELILELKNFDETAPPESERPSISPPETTLPKSTTTLILVVASLVLMGVFIAYYFIRRKP
ncbi:MAG: hypothetical protein HXS54_00795 [Theionarchaea archaeon]|nr:hypothetical protein [Theionarchaea archaeon]